jgi:hypothetical protein
LIFLVSGSLKQTDAEVGIAHQRISSLLDEFPGILVIADLGEGRKTQIIDKAIHIIAILFKECFRVIILLGIGTIALIIEDMIEIAGHVIDAVRNIPDLSGIYQGPEISLLLSVSAKQARNIIAMNAIVIITDILMRTVQFDIFIWHKRSIHIRHLNDLGEVILVEVPVIGVFGDDAGDQLDDRARSFPGSGSDIPSYYMNMDLVRIKQAGKEVTQSDIIRRSFDDNQNYLTVTQTVHLLP